MIPSRRTSCFQDRRVIAETGVIPAGMKLIRDTHEFKILDRKNAIREDRNGNGTPVLRVTGLIQMGDQPNGNGRYYSTNEVLAPAIKQIQEDIKARAVLGEFDHPCINTHDFRVLTVNGWKEFKDIKIGDNVWSRVNGKMVKSRVNGIVDEPYEGPIYNVSGRNINIGFTPGHKCLMTKRPDQNKHDDLYATIEDIYVNRSKYSHSPIPRTADYMAKPSSTVTVPGLSVDQVSFPLSRYKYDPTADLVLDARLFAGLVGIYLAEGYVCGKGRAIQISQKNAQGRLDIANLFDRLGLAYTMPKAGLYCSDARLAAYFKPLGDKYVKFIPNAIKSLSKDCLESLLYWFALGDGRMLKGSRGGRTLSCKASNTAAITTEASLDLGTYSRLALFTVSEHLIRDLHECVVKTGRCGRLSKVESVDDYTYSGHLIEAKNKTVLHQLHVSRCKNVTLDPRFTTIDRGRHSGRIYCLTTEHGNFYMEHRGCSFWTGNSDAKIHLDRVSHLMTNVWMEGRKVFGEAEILHKLPCGACLRGLFEHKVRVGISSRGVGDMEVVSESNGQETYRVLPGYTFVTWDAVAEPSVNGAILNIQEDLKKRISPLKAMKKKFSPSVYQNMVVEEINKFFGLS